MHSRTGQDDVQRYGTFLADVEHARRHTIVGVVFVKPGFAQVLQDLRIARGLTQLELAERARLSVNAISLLERGERKAPRRQTIAALAAALELDAAGRLALESAVRATASMAEDDVPAAPINNLPAHATTFMGRRAEIAAIRRRLTRSQLVTIIGPGGIGKTRIAHEVAASTSHLYAGGTVCLDLAPLNDGNVAIAELAAILGVAQAQVSTVDRLLAHTARLHLLIVLDNCEHLIGDIAPLASRILQAAPRVRLLATSRERLRIAGEALFVLPMLKVPSPSIPLSQLESYDSIALFVERASSPGSPFVITSENAPLITSLCRRLDGIALAIEVVAVRVASLGLSNLDALHVQGEDIQKILSATIAWSHGLLNDSERMLFRRLSRFANGWSMRGAEAVCAGDGLPAHVIADVLASLVEKSLVVAEKHSDTMRYRFLESTRSAAQDRLIEAGEGEAITRRHAIWLADLADMAAASELVTPRNLWHLKYRSDLENAALAADWCLENGHEPVLAIRIVAGFRGIWMHIGRRAEIAARAELALQQIDPHDVKHVALLYRIINAVVGPSRDFNLALEDFADRAKDVFERAGDIAGLAALHGNLAFQLSVLGEFEKAQKESKAALAYFRQAGAERSLVYVPYMIHYGLGQLELHDPGARETLREAVELSRSLKDDDMLGYALSATAVAAFAAGDARRALRILQKTFAKQLSIADTSGVATRSVDLAAYHVAVGDKRASIHSARIAVDKTRGRFTYGFFTALHHLAAALAMNGLLVEGARTAGYLRMLSEIHGFRGTLLERHSLAEYERLVHVGLAPEEVAAEENTGAALGEAELLERVALSLD